MASKIIFIEKNWLEEQYIILQKSMKEIGNELGFSSQTILNWLRKYNIPTRKNTTHTQKTKDKLSVLRSGENNFFFGKKRPEHAELMRIVITNRGPASDATRKKMSDSKKGKVGYQHNRWVHPDQRKGKLLVNIRRTQEMKEWKQRVLEKDCGTCQICFSKEKIQIDHIIPLCFLIKKFEVLKVTDAINNEEFWDINNGRVLCITCHKKTETYGPKVWKLWESYNARYKQTNE